MPYIPPLPLDQELWLAIQAPPPPARKCLCGTTISRYNHHDSCHACFAKLLKAELRERDKRAQMELAQKKWRERQRNKLGGRA